ncbi:MAG: copper chaperone PCu(A)C [Rhodocyclaceae bacterium]
MRTFRTLAALLTACTTLAVSAHSFALGDIQIGHPWARATADGQPTGGAYFSLDNKGVPDRLVAASTPAAESAEVHTMRMEGNVMRMRKVEGGVALPTGQKVVFEPGSYHIMLFGLKAPLKAGDHFPLTLRFEKAGEVTVTVNVEAATAGDQPHGTHH